MISTSRQLKDLVRNLSVKKGGGAHPYSELHDGAIP